jgi:hypothetical protein
VSKLEEIEAAVDLLPAEQKQELLIFLAARLRVDGARLPEPHKFSKKQIAAWIAEDEADMSGTVREIEDACTTSHQTRQRH